jgi:Ca2+-transporting ATPase
MDAFRRLLGTTQINLRQFAWALVPALALLLLWELGKLLARRSASQVTNTIPRRTGGGGTTTT